MVFGALAMSGLFVSLLGRFRGKAEAELAAYAGRLGITRFYNFTLGNVIVGCWYFLALLAELRRLFVGGSIGATVVFILSLILTVGALVAAHKKKVLGNLFPGFIPGGAADLPAVLASIW